MEVLMESIEKDNKKDECERPANAGIEGIEGDKKGN
jgi:hypothetical protein